MEQLVEQVWPILSGVIAIATAVTVFTPNRADNQILDNILRFLNLMAGNFLKNRNRND